MSLNSRMSARKSDSTVREQVRNKLYKEERSYRADRLVEAWARIPEIGAGLKQLPLTDARNVAINLDRQANYMSRLTEAQTSQAFSGFTPENMLRLIRLAMPAIVRNKIFTEFAMETSRDTIKYARPVFTKNQKGNNKMARRHSQGDFGDAGDDKDPYDIETDYSSDYNDFNDRDYRKAMYESTQDRMVQELANAITLENIAVDTQVLVAGKTVTLTAGSTYIVMGKLASNPTEVCEFDKGYIDGYVSIFGASEQDVIAVQNKKTKKFFVADGLNVAIAQVAPGVFKVTQRDPTGNALPTTIRAYGRFASETDFEGDYLGEVEIVMSEYEFRPMATSIGVTWSQLAEISLDTSFSVSAEEFLVSYAAQEIRVALDYRAIRYAYMNALTNPAAYIVKFDAGWNPTTGSTPTKEGYIHNAQTFLTAIDTMGDVMLNDINRGGVSRMVSGPSAGSYCKLIGGFSSKGKQGNVGVHQIGELEDIPLFKAPSSIIPTNRILTVWKNDANDADVALAFGTLVPFFSTGIIQRKNFYKEAALATYGDYALLNKRYLGVIQIDNLKDKTSN